MADTTYTHRPRLIVETEIAAARWAFLRADETGDYTLADAAYATMDRLLEEHAHIPRQRQP